MDVKTNMGMLSRTAAVLLAALSCGTPAPGADKGPGTCSDPPEGTANVTVKTSARPGAVRKTVAFLGGSITEMDGFRPRVMKALRERYPQIDFVEIAAGLASTCSDAGAFRIEEDVLAKGTPDLFIVEAAVNDEQDGHFSETRSIRGMEGAVRHVLLKNPACAVVVALMVNRRQYDELMSGVTPLQYVAHAKVAAHYGAALADVGSALVASARSGAMDWEPYRDCHPSPAGCALGARTVVEAVTRVFDPMAPARPRTLPPPLDAKSYFRGRFLSRDEVRLGEGWTVSRPDGNAIAGNKRAYFTVGPATWSERPGAELRFTFSGDAAGLFLTAGPDAGDMEVSIDGGPCRRERLRADYGTLHYPYMHLLADGLREGTHEVCVRVVPAARGDGKAGMAVRIHRVCVNGSK